MSDRRHRPGQDNTNTTGGGVQRSAGKRTLSERRYGGVQAKRGTAQEPPGVGVQRASVETSTGLDPASVHAAADQGIAGPGGALPFGDQIQASFGSHDISGVRAHTDGAAQSASAAMGASAYAKGDAVAFGSTPDLHTAAHEAAHVVQQRGGVQLKGGVGEDGDAYEQHADAVADKVVAGESAEPLLSSMTGASDSHAVQSKAVQKLGVPLDKELPAGQAAPAFGEDKGHQRKWSPEQYVEMWEKEQGRKMTAEEKATIDRGCIGITANNLHGGGDPLDSAEKCYGTFDQAHEAMKARNNALEWMAKIPFVGSLIAGSSRYVLFAKLFWSNQSKKWEDRFKPDDKAFLPDPKTGEVDMSGYNYEAQSKWKTDKKTGEKKKSSYINFDYGFWDDASNCFWHANHMDYGDPDDPMIVLQSTKDKFTAGYFDFDRIIFCIAKADNYDAGLAALASGRKTR